MSMVLITPWVVKMVFDVDELVEMEKIGRINDEARNN